MLNDSMKTELNKNHRELGANMVNFHGWDMPLYYESIIKEHNYVREKCGVFDVSHMGDIFIEGKDAKETLMRLLPTDIGKVKDGQCVYSAFLNEDGKMIDDTIIYKFNNEKFLCVPNASMIDIIFNHIFENIQGDVKIKNKSNNLSCLAIQGKMSDIILNKLGLEFPEFMKFYEKNSMIISGTGYTGEKGCEIILENDLVQDLWKNIIMELKGVGGGPCGLGSRDTLRMEKGMLLSGQDFNSDKNPYESSISFIVNMDHDFIGRNSLLKNNEPELIFRGFVMDDKNSFPRHGSKIHNLENEDIGYITSGTISPTLKKGIGLGYVRREHRKIGTEVLIETRKGFTKGYISKPKIIP